MGKVKAVGVTRKGENVLYQTSIYTYIISSHLSLQYNVHAHHLIYKRTTTQQTWVKKVAKI